MNLRILSVILACALVGFGAASAWLLTTYERPAVDPAWQMSASTEIPEGSVTVRYTGTSTLLFSDGETSWMVDGWFSRFGPLELLLRRIGPDIDAIASGLAQNQVDRLDVVIPVHSHFDHAMDAPEVAKRTGAILLGSESTANIARGWGLAEDQIQIAVDRQPMQFGRFTITLIATRHFEFPNAGVANQALADPEIREPLVPPVKATEYRVGQPYAIHVVHPRGRWLIQGSAGYIEGGLAGYEADVVFLGIGGLGGQSQAYREAYWHETVTTVGATHIVPIHWDNLTGPTEGPFTGPVRATTLVIGGGAERTLEFLRTQTNNRRDLRFSTLARFDEIVLF